MLICTFIAAVFEIPTCFTHELDIELLTSLKEIYFLARIMMPVLFVLYIISVTDSYKIIEKRKLLLYLLVVPFFITIGVILSNPLTNAVFYYDADGYHRGFLIFILYSTSTYYLGYGLIYLIICRKFFSRYQYVSLLSVIPLNIIAVVIQIFYKEYLVELFASTLSFIMICSAIETPNEQLDVKTNLLSGKKYMNSLYIAYALKNDVNTVLVKVLNYSNIYTLLSYTNARKYILHMSIALNKRYKDRITKYTCYSLEDGLFAIVTTNYDDAIKLANYINKDFKALDRVKLDFRPNAHICVTNVIDDFEDISVFSAFISNYRNRLVFSDEILEINKIKNEKSFIIESNIDTIVDDSIKNNEFEVYYQPIYSVKDDKFISAEALVRLNSSKYGFINPDLFIECAEKNRKIHLIDNFVFEEVIKFIASDTFDRIGLKYIETNLSIVDCVDPTLYSRFKELIEKYNVDGSKINIELTETVDANKEAIDININLLQKLGINFSLDDYGIGYSNINRFTKLPLKLVKIDKSLIDRYENEVVSKVLNNTFKMIKDLGRDILVEGIETKEQVEKFIKDGCDYIQGYYYSAPLTKDEFIEFVMKNNKIKN